MQHQRHRPRGVGRRRRRSQLRGAGRVIIRWHDPSAGGPPIAAGLGREGPQRRWWWDQGGQAVRGVKVAPHIATVASAVAAALSVIAVRYWSATGSPDGDPVAYELHWMPQAASVSSNPLLPQDQGLDIT